jgi:hypothetical protein
MFKFSPILSVAFMALFSGQALAQTGMQALTGPPPPTSITGPTSSTSTTGGIPQSVYGSANVGQFLALCGSDQGGCADEVGTALMDKMVFDGTANICLPGPDYPGAVIEYLRAHPETHSMPTEDGIYMAIGKVYSCS